MNYNYKVLWSGFLVKIYVLKVVPIIKHWYILANRLKIVILGHRCLICAHNGHS